MSGKQKPAAAPAADTEPQLPAVVAPAPSRALTADLSVQDLLRQREAIKSMIGQVLLPEVHYGASFPGDKKQNLLQPGADALIVAFGLVARFANTREDIVIPGEGMHREYTVVCTLLTRSGIEVGSGIGSCSTMESKYRWRWAKPLCPSCGKETIAKSKEEWGGGWYCNANRDGCGAKFPKGSRDIEGQQRGKVPNADIADTYNTILKIAAKRAKVAAAIAVTGCSDMFTQDVEDHEDGDAASQRQDQGKRDAGARPAPTQPAAAAAPVQPAAPAAAPAAAPVAGSTQLDADIATAYEQLVKAASKPIAERVFRRWTKEHKAERLEGLRRMVAAMDAIALRLGSKSERIVADLTFDRSDPDNVDGMIADLERAAGSSPAPKPAPAPAAAAAPADDDAPPF